MKRITTLVLVWAAGLHCTMGTALAQGAPWPQRTIKIVTPTPAGVGSDIFARSYAEQLSRLLKVPVIVENRPGALATIGTDAVAKATPGGYTVLFSTSNPFTMTPFLLSRLPYNPKEDLVPVTQALKGGSFIVANNAVPARNTDELIALARRRPGHVSFASYGSGSTSHLGFELLQEAASVEMLHVPYKQGAMPDVIGGQVMLGFEPPISALPNIKAGRVKALAYTGSQRSTALPDVPTVAERYPGFEVSTWLGFWVPARTPDAIVEQLNRAITAATRSPEMTRQIADVGLEPMSTNTADTRAIIEREAQTMGRLIKAKGLRLD